MPRQISEELTRKEMIDPQLEKAGWYLRDQSKVKIEIPVDGYDAEPWNGVSDYCLYRENGEVLAVVEAKGYSIDVSLATTIATYLNGFSCPLNFSTF
jgi:type I site-specific restriction endonuclease